MIEFSLLAGVSAAVPGVRAIFASVKPVLADTKAGINRIRQFDSRISADCDQRNVEPFFSLTGFFQ
ncbi:MAG: hypothetical protein CSB48_02765 [Proteobacteria bacterium]|nr:MAG: hypothetical protein CSB48_02765 [Pseudomonadota bacterium]